MTKFFRILLIVCFTLAVATMAQAQATRTWVSGVGDDANPCSRTAPCKTFAGAISKTAVDGEIDALDPAGFGAVTITRSITIDGCCMVSILGAGTTSITINITSGTDLKKTVRLRNISMNGASTGVFGIRYIAANKVYVEHCQIYGMQSSAASRGIVATGVATGSQLYVKDTIISNCASGIDASAASGSFVSVLDNVNLEGMTDGLILGSGASATLRNSFVVLNTGAGVKMNSGSAASIEHTVINHNATGIQANTGSTTDLSSTVIIGNATAGISNSGGTVQSHGNNSFNLNGPSLTPAPINNQ